MNNPHVPLKYYIAEFSDRDNCIINMELTEKEIDDMVIGNWSRPAPLSLFFF